VGGLTPVVTPTKGRHLRVVQSNVSDAQFLKELAVKARDPLADLSACGHAQAGDPETRLPATCPRCRAAGGSTASRASCLVPTVCTKGSCLR